MSNFLVRFRLRVFVSLWFTPAALVAHSVTRILFQINNDQGGERENTEGSGITGFRCWACRPVCEPSVWLSAAARQGAKVRREGLHFLPRRSRRRASVE